MSESFNMDNLPFSLLTQKEQATLNSHLDIAYFQKGETIITAGEVPEGVFIVLKGKVGETHGF